MRRKFEGFIFEVKQDGTIAISQSDPMEDDHVVLITLDDAPVLVKCLQDAIKEATHRGE